MERQTLSVLTGYTLRYGLRAVSRWIERALIGVSRLPTDTNLGRYISGIRRSEFPEDAP